MNAAHGTTGFFVQQEAAERMHREELDRLRLRHSGIEIVEHTSVFLSQPEKVQCDGKQRLFWPECSAGMEYMVAHNYSADHWELRLCPNPAHGYHLRFKRNPPPLIPYEGSEVRAPHPPLKNRRQT